MWLDADSRTKEIGNLGNKAESETRLCRTAVYDPLYGASDRMEGGAWQLLSKRQELNLAAADPI